jgi:MYXO-CTERM domain-containing protein
MDVQRAALTIGVVSLLALGAPPAARACGGFFCNQQIPIDQSGEQIVFSIRPDGVTAHILIQYQGNARDFSWVVPVMSRPVIKVGTNTLFTTLLRQTQPRFAIDPASLNVCNSVLRGTSAGGDAESPSRPNGGVNVVEMREVGPFATVILESTDAAELITWLKDNGYDQPPESTPLIEHYVKQKMLFVALKLKQDATTGDIQPLVLEMPHPEACVPLILTRVAAVRDMPVQVFVLGPHRAFPSNWFHVEINQKRIDWRTGGSNYRQLVTDAINEAAGRGFVTEYAGGTQQFANQLVPLGNFDLGLVQLRAATQAVQLVQLVLSLGLPRGDAVLLALLRKYVPMPESLRATGVSENQFYSNISQFQSALGMTPVDGAAFTAELEMRIITPLREAQAMVDGQPYLTRLYATVSPDEMTRDPLFHFNAELPPVSNVHMAKAVGGVCSSGSLTKMILELEDGSRIALDGAVTTRPYPFEGRPVEAAGSGPAAARIQLVGSRGSPASYGTQEAFTVDQALDRDHPDLVREMHPGLAGRSSGCAVGGGGTVAPLALAGLAALLALARRRRRRR